MSENLTQTGLDNKDICHLKSHMREEKKGGRKEGRKRKGKKKEREKYPEVRGALGNG